MPATADAAVHTTIDAQGIATLTIRGAKSMNIIGTSHIVAATEAMNQLATDPAVRVLVLRGPDDRAFVGGADINEMAALTPATAEVFITGLKNLCEAARLFPAPVGVLDEQTGEGADAFAPIVLMERRSAHPFGRVVEMEKEPHVARGVGFAKRIALPRKEQAE